MGKVSTIVQVARDGTISGKAPEGIVPGEHKVEFEVGPATARLKFSDLPIDNCGPWPSGITFRRVDI